MPKLCSDGWKQEDWPLSTCLLKSSGGPDCSEAWGLTWCPHTCTSYTRKREAEHFSRIFCSSGRRNILWQGQNQGPGRPGAPAEAGGPRTTEGQGRGDPCALWPWAIEASITWGSVCARVCCVCVRGGLGRGHRRWMETSRPGSPRDQSKLWEVPSGTNCPGPLLFEHPRSQLWGCQRGGGSLGEREALSGSSLVQQTVEQFWNFKWLRGIKTTLFLVPCTPEWKPPE